MREVLRPNGHLAGFRTFALSPEDSRCFSDDPDILPPYAYGLPWHAVSIIMVDIDAITTSRSLKSSEAESGANRLIHPSIIHSAVAMPITTKGRSNSQTSIVSIREPTLPALRC